MIARRRRTTRLRAAAGLLLAGCLTSCVQIPTGGPVVSVDAKGQAATVEAPYSQPRPPHQGDTPEQIVQGFLNAMTAVPVQTSAARQFLSKDAGARWKPQHRVVVYDPPTTPRGISAVTLRLRGGHVLGPRGDWRGKLPGQQSRLTLPMQLEGKEYRIAQVPDALLVTQTFFDQNYQRVSLDFFDPTGRILVPEQVYLPSGDQLAGALVRGVLEGPRRANIGVDRTFIPPGLTTAQLAVPVVKGVAQLTLKGPDPGLLSPKTTQLMLAQLAATLGQDAAISAFRVSIDGRPVTDQSGAATFRAVAQPAYDSATPLASVLFYAVRDGLLVSGGSARSLNRASGPFATQRVGIRSFAISLDLTSAAVTTRDSLLVGRNDRPVVSVLNGASGLLRPSYDFAGRIWEVSSDPGSGARVTCVRNGRPHRVRVPGVSGRQVKQFLVSRDGSRLVAVERGANADRIVVSRLRYDANGRPIGATRASPIPWQSGGSPRVRDLGWTSPTSLGVLHLLTRGFSEVRTVSVDGSTIASESTGNIIAGRVTGLVTSPAANQTSFAIQHGALVDIRRVDPIPNVPISQLRDLTYVG